MQKKKDIYKCTCKANFKIQTAKGENFMKYKELKTVLFILFLFCCSSSDILFAQTDNDPITCGNYRKIHSTVLGEERTLLIRLPEDYSKSDKKYPVLYKLDGNKGTFLQAFSAAYYLFDMTDSVPDPIIVGIENTDRNRDMGPDQRADNFIQFIKSELIPFVDTNYRTNGFRILCGQSYSSVFALFSFLKQPDVFDAYFLGSFGLYKESLAVLFEDELKRNQALATTGKKYLFMANGKLDTYDLDGSVTKRGDRFLESLKKIVPATVLLKYKMYDDEGHIPFPTIYDGLRWVYSYEKAEIK
jgi:predicted alpha/beta superfamily hydrolase